MWRQRNLRATIAADARFTALHRGERCQFRSKLDTVLQCIRLAWVSDAFLAQMLYRVKARTLGMPIVPRLAHRLAIIFGQVAIGDPVVMAPSVYIVHGQVVIDGITRIGSNVIIAPHADIGLRAGNLEGPVIESNVRVGTGAKILGPFHIGEGAVIGANAVVTGDVAPGTTVVGVPARPI